MKPCFVSGMVADQTLTSFFVVCEKEIRSTREGKTYLRLELGDRTGRIEARMWTGFEVDAASFQRNDFVKVQARVESYRNKLQVAIDKIRRAEDHEVDEADFSAHTTEDIDVMYGKLLQTVASVNDPWLKTLLESVVLDPAIVPRLKRAPAGKVMHHAYIGGLLEHVVSLCGLCTVVLKHYPEADPDLLLAGAVLHDIGKLEELSYGRSLGYTDAGQLLGHICIEYEWIANKIAAIPGFPAELKTLVQHMIVSHHGRYEFGSPKLPMFREAVMLHYLDDLDSKMAAVRASLASDHGEGNWTAYSGALERRVLRVERFRQDAAPSGIPPAGPLQEAVDRDSEE